MTEQPKNTPSDTPGDAAAAADSPAQQIGRAHV